MVFVSHNKIRKCKYCDHPPKINMSGGKHKGYYRTCGSTICIKQQYKDSIVNKNKGRVVNKENLICFLCESSFERISANHKKYCKECVPDPVWRGRAHRYGIGKKQWDAMLEKQNGSCFLCNKIPEVVDHCHRGKNVRALLCNGCNIQIAKMDSDRNWLKKALKYIGEI